LLKIKKNIDPIDSDGNKMFKLVGLTAIRNIDFKKAAQLHICLGVSSIEELYKACKEGRVAPLEGWGIATESRLKSDIEVSILWLNAQCAKAKKTYGVHDYQKTKIDKEFLLKLAKELEKNK
jgi:DNA polymerase/3'-5' exonuclease PolX